MRAPDALCRFANRRAVRGTAAPEASRGHAPFIVLGEQYAALELLCKEFAIPGRSCGSRSPGDGQFGEGVEDGMVAKAELTDLAGQAERRQPGEERAEG